MSIRDAAAANASLDNDYGATKGANSPVSHVLALFAGAPENGGVEMDSVGGYARQTITNDVTGWPTAAANRQKTSASVSFGTSTAAWTAGGVAAVATHGALLGSDGLWWDTGLLGVPIDISAAGVTVAATCTVRVPEVA